MKRVIEKIRQLYRDNARHRKGFYILDATPTLAASNAVEELGELLVELALGTRHRSMRTAEDVERQRDELADVVGVVIHLAVMLEHDYKNGTIDETPDSVLEALEARIIAKLDRRFTCEPQT